MLDEGKKIFLQMLIDKVVLPMDSANRLFSGCKGPEPSGDADLEDLSAFIHTLNEEIEPFSFCLRFHTCHVTGEKFLVFVNAADDLVAQEHASSLRQEEIGVFKKILEAIGAQESFSVDIADLSRSLPGCSEALVRHFVSKNWLCLVPETNLVAIGVRSCVELANWLRETLQLRQCTVCGEPVTFGETGKLCANDGCQGRLHLHCMQRMKSAPKAVCSDCAY